MKIGAMQSTLTHTDDANLFTEAHNAGVEGMELEIRKTDLQGDWAVQRDFLIGHAKSSGVTVPSTCLGFHNDGGIASWWRGRDAEEEVLQGIGMTQSLGATLMLLPFFFSNEPKGRTHRAAVAERLKPLCARAADLGVTIAFEGVLPAEHLVELAAAVDSPAFGIYYDVANATWCDYEPAAEIAQLGSLIKQVHVKDAKVFTGDVRPGQGRVNWTAWRDALRSVGYRGWYVLESPRANSAIIARDVQFVRELFAECRA